MTPEELAPALMRIGLFGFGGGLATIPLYLNEVQAHHWMSRSEFLDLVALSQITPGPVAVTMAIHLGRLSMGWLGALLAPFILITPSLLAILILSVLLTRWRESPWKKALFGGIQTAGLALICFAGWVILADTFRHSTNLGNKAGGVILLIVCLLIRVYRPQVPPILLLVLSAVLGFFLF